MNKSQTYKAYVDAIAESELSIYDSIEVGDPDLWIPTPALEFLLRQSLKGMSVQGLPIRTRSKVVKQAVCCALGYPVPKSFRRTHPRFPGQQFDTYIQKSNNLQIWNEEIVPLRRYVIIHVSPEDVIENVKVVIGEMLVKLDKTGTLTQKYQARISPKEIAAELLVANDTPRLQTMTTRDSFPLAFERSAACAPTSTSLLPITEIFERLKSLIGYRFPNVGYDQERSRGADLHQLVCSQLGYRVCQDTGSFPDLPHQLLEVKLQTSPTIDLGLVLPSSQETLDTPQIGGYQIRYCDVRYAIFYAQTDDVWVKLTHFYLTTGEAFFEHFPQFQGNVVNKKLQIPLPDDFFTAPD